MLGGLITSPPTSPQPLEAIAHTTPKNAAAELGWAAARGDAIPASAIAVVLAWTAGLGSLGALAWRRLGGTVSAVPSASTPRLRSDTVTTRTSRVTGTDFVCVPTRDYEAAKRFYGDVLGLEFSKPWGKLPAGEFETGSLTLAVMESEAFGTEFRPTAGIALRVDDVAAARSELESRGVEFSGDILDSGVCHQAFFQDPDGNQLILHHRYAPPDARPS